MKRVGLSPRVSHKIQRCRCGPPCTVHCWEWQGCRDHVGYGRTRSFIYGHQEVYVHRLAWAAANGRVAKQEVCHACDNPSCCNPSHLWEGTHTQNHKDSQRKGRRAVKVWAARTHRILELLRTTTFSQRQIAREVGVSQPRVCAVRRQEWKRAQRQGSA
jgi:predicted XRE-type DNA-binding protein